MVIRPSPRQTAVGAQSHRASGGAGRHGPEDQVTGYPGATYERLVRVKRRVDPDNVFHANQNIRPD